jgi:large subunit ribosomal protein L18
MGRVTKKVSTRLRRKKRVRKRITGTSECPRLTVFRSSKHLYAQVIDDVSGHTIASASTLSPDLKAAVSGLSKIEAAKQVGTLVAQRAKDAKVNQVVFDRNGYLYTGRVAAIADAAREVGLKF